MWPLIFEGCLASRSLTPNWTENELLSANCAKVNRDVFRALAPVSWSRKAAWQPHCPPQTGHLTLSSSFFLKKKKRHFPLPLYWQPQIVQKNVGNKISVMKKKSNNKNKKRKNKPTVINSTKYNSTIQCKISCSCSVK